MLVGNKCDLARRVGCTHHAMFATHTGSPTLFPFFQAVSKEKAQALADSHGLPYIETSAKENINVDKVSRYTAHMYTLPLTHPPLLSLCSALIL